jgi:hypothetical protein
VQRFSFYRFKVNSRSERRDSKGKVQRLMNQNRHYFPCQEMNQKVLTISSQSIAELSDVEEKNVKGGGRYCPSIQQTTVNVSIFGI